MMADNKTPAKKPITTYVSRSNGLNGMMPVNEHYPGVDTKYVRLKDHEQVLAALSDPNVVLVNMLRGSIAVPDVRSWSKLFGDVINDEAERLLEIAKLRAERNDLRRLLRQCRDAERSVKARLLVSHIDDAPSASQDAEK